MPVKSSLHISSAGNIAQMIRPQVQQNVTPRVQAVTQRARQLAPVGETRRMKNAIVMRARDAGGRFASHNPDAAAVCSYEIAVMVPYATHVLRGTAPHKIHSHGPWPLQNRFTGQVFGPEVNHPGQKANNFLLKALDEVF